MKLNGVDNCDQTPKGTTSGQRPIQSSTSRNPFADQTTGAAQGNASARQPVTIIQGTSGRAKRPVTKPNTVTCPKAQAAYGVVMSVAAAASANNVFGFSQGRCAFSHSRKSGAQV